ncbi:hypothetical protein [Halioxenophilus aromaticivorans]|uniref:Lipocalin-like domain-containing protein n=1 Tax=Halioxenophilus aromaticivorans TaxID=1306992 RepID=A0AAV3U515_9ALTE
MTLTALLALIIATSINSVTASPATSFAGLKKLVGTWKVEGDDSGFHIAYELTANETVLIESWVSNGKKHFLTVYHMDNDRLIASPDVQLSDEPGQRRPGLGSLALICSAGAATTHQ